MRINLTILVLTICCLQLSANVFGQRITLNMREVPLADVLRSIEKQSDYTFFYRKQDLAGLEPVTISVTGESVGRALDKIFENKPYTFDIQEKVIVLRRDNLQWPAAIGRSPATPEEAQQQITGRVTDSLNAPIPGASVVIKGTQNGTVADTEGQYRIEAKPGDILVFRAIGYTAREVTVAAQTTVDIVLKVAQTDLDEVIVVAFGEQKKITTVGAQSTIKPQELKQPVANLSQSTLFGRSH